jgi:hypothetical protein
MFIMASANPSGKRRGSIAIQPRKRAKPTPVLRSRLSYTSFSNFVSQIIIPAVKENEYTYTPLTKPDEIRLLIISPSANLEDPVYCQLVSTADHPADAPPLTYEALSYTWGNDDPIHEIKLLNLRREGHRPTLKKLWAKFYVRRNLHAALRYLRDSAHPITLWVDALCINQKDDTERNIQVKRMAEIYNQASNVCVWLGVGDPPSKAALDSIPKMLEGSTFDEYIEDESKSGIWQSLALLMRNPWFSRRYVNNPAIILLEITKKYSKMGCPGTSTCKASNFALRSYRTRLGRLCCGRSSVHEGLRTNSHIGSEVGTCPN